MTLQEFIDFDQFVRCYCIGQEEVMIMPYDPRKPYLSGEQYIHNPDYLAPAMKERVTNDVRTLCGALGYDINTVEFAIKDGIPYAIDFMNPAPDAELESVGEFYHHWVTGAVTDLVFKRLTETRERPRYRWDAFLSPQPARPLAAVASAAEQAARTIIPQSVREVPMEVAGALTDIVAKGAEAIAQTTESIVTVESEAGDKKSKPKTRGGAAKKAKK
jgi:hypothetical protein